MVSQAKIVKNSYEKLKITKTHKTPPNYLNASSSPLDRHYHVPSLNHLVSKSSTNFVKSLPFGNELNKHKSREE
jgi:hypothetical protein